MSLSSASPGCNLFSIPSRPAISIAENARYVLQDGSGNLTSTLFAFGLAEYVGILIDAERFLAIHMDVALDGRPYHRAVQARRRGYQHGVGALLENHNRKKLDLGDC